METTGPRATNALQRFAGVAIEWRTYRRLAYLALAFPLGIAYFVALVVVFSVGVGLAVVLIGIPLLLAGVALAVGLVAVERWQASALLGVEYEDPFVPEYEDAGELAVGLLTARRTLLGVVYLPSKFFVGIGALVLLATTFGTAISFVLTPLYYEGAEVGIHLPETIHLSADVVIGWGGREIELAVPVTIGSWIADSILDALALSAVGLVLLLASLHLTNAVGWLLGRYARVMLR